MTLRIFLLALFAATFANAQDGVRSDDVLLDVEELESILKGQIVEFFDGSKSRYSEDGVYGYTYTDDGPVWSGRYAIVGLSEVCVDFDNGSRRCDFLVNDGNRMILVTSDGTRFPIRNITVDDTSG